MSFFSGQAFQLFREYLCDPRNWIRNVAWRFPRAHSDSRIIFVVGAPRSGTTLVQRILAVHPRCFTIPGETALFSARNLFVQPARFTLTAEETTVLYRKSHDVVEFLENAASALAERAGGRDIFIEKTPQHVFSLPFIRRYFPNGRIINVVRDGRDCFCSAQGHAWIPQRHSVREFAMYWRNCIRAAARGTNSAMISIRYEDLSRDPEATVRRTMEFMGLPFEGRQLDETAIGDDRRSDAAAFRRLKEPISTSSCGRWRAELTTTQLATFNDVAGEELKAWGYPVE